MFDFIGIILFLCNGNYRVFNNYNKYIGWWVIDVKTIWSKIVSKFCNRRIWFIIIYIEQIRKWLVIIHFYCNYSNKAINRVSGNEILKNNRVFLIHSKFILYYVDYIEYGNWRVFKISINYKIQIR